MRLHYRSARYGIAALAAVLLLLLLPTSGSTAAELPPPRSPVPLEHDDSDLIAKALNISGAEASYRRSLDGEITKFQQQSVDVLKEHFGGFWVAQTPKFGIFVATTLETFAEETLGVPKELDGLVSVVNVPRSYSELLKISDTAADGLRSQGIEFESEIDVQANSVTAYVTIDIADSVPPALANVEGLQLKTADRLGSASASIYGGLAMTSCTSGFSVAKSTGTKGILDAGHCPNAQTFTSSGVASTFKAEAWGGNSDLEWRTVSSAHTIQPWIYDGQNDSTTPYYRKINGEEGLGGLYVGKSICKYGKATGLTCDTIRTLNVRPSWIPNADDTYVKMGVSGSLVAGGDSGGPVVNGDAAVGIVSGELTAGGMVFTPATYMSNLGLCVLLANAPSLCP